MRLLRSMLFVIVFLTMFLLPAALRAQSGGAGLSFLKIGVGARALGMGDAGVAGDDRGSAMYYNPALLADDERAAVTFTHNEWIEDISTEFIGVTLPAKGWTFGVHLGLTSVGHIEIRDRPGEPLAETDNNNFAGGLSAAFVIADGIDVGLTAKYVFEKLHVEEAGGYAFDFGVAIRPFSDGDLAHLRTGITLANVGSMSELASVATTLPMLLRYGAAYLIPVDAVKGALTIEANGLTLLEENSTHLNLGIEFDYLGMVFLRAGYQTGYDTKDISLGAGAMYGTLRFDYAFTPFSEVFGNAHTVALSVLL